MQFLRRFVLPFVTAAGLLLQSCGGGSSSGSLPATSNPAQNLGSGVAVQSGTIQLPAGSKIAASSLTIRNILGSAPVSNSGNFGLNAFTSGPQLAQVTTPSGNPMLMGFLGSAEPAINVHTTAEALLFLAGGLYQLPKSEREQAYAALSTTAGFSNVENAIGTELSLNSDAFGSVGGEKIVAAAVSQFFASLHASTSAASKKAPKDILVDPSNGQSGVTVLNTSPVQISFANTYRRPSRAFIDQVSFGVNSGSSTNVVQERITDIIPAVDVPAVTALKSFKSGIADIAGGNYAWSEVKTSPVTLTPRPNAYWSRYAVTVVGPGFSDGAKNALSPERLKAQDDLTINFLISDLVIPELSSIIIPLSDLDKIGPLVPSITKDILGAISSDIPAIRAAYQSGDYGGATFLMLTAITKSSTYQKSIINDFIAAEAVDNPGAQAAMTSEFASQLQNGLKAADVILVGTDLLKITKDLSSSNQADVFTVYAVTSKINLTPTSSTISNDVGLHLHVDVPSAGGSDLLLTYQWLNTAAFGHFTDLTGNASHVDNFSVTGAGSDGIYTSKPSPAAGSDTVTVKVIALDSSGSKIQRIDLGSASATVTVTPAPTPTPPAAGDLGPIPLDLPQSRCAAMVVSPHQTTLAAIAAGGTINGVAGPPTPLSCGGDLPDAVPMTWTWFWDIGEANVIVVSGCTLTSATCSFRPKSTTGSAGHRYVRLCINGSSRQGPWTSCDYYAVVP